MLLRRPVGFVSSFAILVALLVAGAPARAQAPLRVASPDGPNEVAVGLREGVAYYRVDRAGKHAILPSRLGFTFRGTRPLGDSLRMVGSELASRDTTWSVPWGEVARVREHYNELRVRLAEIAAPRVPAT